MISLRPFIVELKIVTKERGTVRIEDVINDSQEQLIAEVERQLNTRGKIRVITLKARQMGISTIIEAIIFTLSIVHPDFQSLIISHEQESAEHILNMTKRYWNTYVFKEMHDERYVSRKQLAWSDNNSNIVVATAKNTDAGRSKTLHALHASEVAMWDNPDELMDGLRQAIPNTGLTAIFIESTAKGIGNFFHTTWLDAIKGESEYNPQFYPWHQFPGYTAQFVEPEQLAKFSLQGKPLDDEELQLRAMGVTDERLLWRRWAIVNLCRNNLDTFHQEYPSTWQEAFLSTGLNVFRKPDLDRHYRPFQPEVGFLQREPNGSIKFVPHERGHLYVYRRPSKDKNWGVYQIGADPTHTTVGDYACAQVLSRRTLEQCAVLRKKCNPMEFGRELELLGEWYNMATIAPEKTGPGYGTVTYLKTRGYPHVWESVKLAAAPGQVQDDTWGWVTNMQTKQMAVGYLVDLTGQHVQDTGNTTYGLIIHDETTYNEMVSYIRTDKGGFENGQGNDHDDTVMALAISAATHFADPPLHAYTQDTTAIDAARAIAEQVPETLRRSMLSPSTDDDGSLVLTSPAPLVLPSTQSEPSWKEWE